LQGIFHFLLKYFTKEIIQNWSYLVAFFIFQKLCPRFFTVAINYTKDVIVWATVFFQSIRYGKYIDLNLVQWIFFIRLLWRNNFPTFLFFQRINLTNLTVDHETFKICLIKWEPISHWEHRLTHLSTCMKFIMDRFENSFIVPSWRYLFPLTLFIIDIFWTARKTFYCFIVPKFVFRIIFWNALNWNIFLMIFIISFICFE
jgi:hypothetical protein